MAYIHSKGLIHRDLKPENILFSEHMHAKIADFGLARSDVGTMTLSQGTPQYMAPEVIISKDYTNKIDVFSFGQIVLEVLSKEPLFPNEMTVFSIQTSITNGNLPQIPDNIDPEMSELIKNCRSLLPEERPSFELISNILAKRVNQKAFTSFITQECLACYTPKEVARKFAELQYTQLMQEDATNQNEEMPNEENKHIQQEIIDQLKRELNLVKAELQKYKQTEQNPDTLNYSLGPLLIDAVKNGQYEKVDALLKQKANYNYHGQNGVLNYSTIHTPPLFITEST